MPETKRKILIVDDHPVVREGIAMLINREPDLEVCCSVSSIEEAIKANQRCKHDLAIVDMSLSGTSGFELLKKFQFDSPDLPVLMVSMHDEAVYAEPALKAGARGYIMKQVATSTMLQAIRQILQGELYVSDQIRTRMLQRAVHGKPSNSPISTLTPGEFEILHLIGMGCSTSEIAERLSRSIKTIEAHRANIKRKLDLANSSQLVHFAINLVSSMKDGEKPSA
jgi:DNA-binding NarL/FixJ family response regulator